MMAPSLRIHQSVLSALFLQIGTYLQGKPCQVYPAPFAVRPFEKDGAYHAAGIYTAGCVPVGIWEDYFSVDLSQIFTE